MRLPEGVRDGGVVEQEIAVRVRLDDPVAARYLHALVARVDFDAPCHQVEVRAHGVAHGDLERDERPTCARLIVDQSRLGHHLETRPRTDRLGGRHVDDQHRPLLERDRERARRLSHEDPLDEDGGAAHAPYFVLAGLHGCEGTPLHPFDAAPRVRRKALRVDAVD